MSRIIEPPDKLLDLIYDAASEQDLWRSVLTEIADLTGSQGGVLFGLSVTGTRVYFDFTGRISEECNRAYQERHMHNPWFVGMRQQPVGRIVPSDEILPLSALQMTSFFDEVLRPQDIAHNTMSALAAKDDFRAAFNICRSARQGPVGQDELRFLERLMPHLRRSLLLGFRLEAYEALHRAQHSVLDQLSVGVILLDRRARIIYVNAGARTHDAEGGPLLLRNATVSTYSPAHTQRLGDLVRAALQGTPAAAMSVPRPNDGHLLTILVSSVRSRDVARFADLNMADAAVMLFIVDPIAHSGVRLAWIIDAFGLTPAQAKVALAASSGLTIPRVAGQLGLSPNTIKTHLRKVFAKTGTSRQAELARLMASIGLLKADEIAPYCQADQP